MKKAKTNPIFNSQPDPFLSLTLPQSHPHPFALGGGAPSWVSAEVDVRYTSWLSFF